MKYFSKIPLFLFLPLFSLAQSNYKPGYVVRLNGDTVHGFINYREWDKNPKNISFKNTLGNSAAENFTPQNINEFAVNGYEYFKRFVVKISQDQVEMSNVKQGADTSYITAAVFLRVLTPGKNVSLFGYTDEIKTRYYILAGTETQPQELVYRVYYSLENSTLQKIDNRYRVQLEYLAQKYNVSNNELETQISNAEYQEADLAKITRVINGETAKQFTPKSRLGTRWYAGFGVTDNNLSFVGVIKYPNNSSTYPKVSAGFDLFLNKSTQRLFLRAELSLTENDHSFSYGPDASSYSSSLDNVIQRNISLSPQVVYNIYNADNFKLFINIGVQLNLSFYNNYHFTEKVSNITTVTNEFPKFPQSSFSFPAKAGAVLNKRIEIYMGYTLITSIIDNFQPFTGKVYEYQAGINYLLNVK
jgi:hypothetical protein